MQLEIDYYKFRDEFTLNLGKLTSTEPYINS